MEWIHFSETLLGNPQASCLHSVQLAYIAHEASAASQAGVGKQLGVSKRAFLLQEKRLAFRDSDETTPRVTHSQICKSAYQNEDILVFISLFFFSPEDTVVAVSVTGILKVWIITSEVSRMQVSKGF